MLMKEMKKLKRTKRGATQERISKKGTTEKRLDDDQEQQITVEVSNTEKESQKLTKRIGDKRKKLKQTKQILKKRKRSKDDNVNDDDDIGAPREQRKKSAKTVRSIEIPQEEEFDATKIRVLKYRLSDIYSTSRCLFLKVDQSDPSALLVHNIPPFITVESIQTLIENSVAKGLEIKNSVLKRSMLKDNDPNETYRVVSVRFAHEYDLEKVLRNCDKMKETIVCLSSLGIDISSSGITKYVNEYRKAIVPSDELQERVDKFFEVYDTKVIEEKRKAKKMHNVPDEEGWITVTRSRFKPVPAAVVVKNTEDLLKFAKNKKKLKDNLPFYTFQMKQSKLKHLEELRRNFEEDKKKLAIAKAARKFRPS